MINKERNYGCRYQEISIYGFKALILENEVLRVLLLIDKGCEIVEFNYKKLDIDFVWRAPNGLASLRTYNRSYNDELLLTDHYIGGWFDAFPLGGFKGNYYGAPLPNYGEACYLPWDYQVLNDDEKEIKIKAFCKMIRSPFYLEKEITIRTGDPSLEIKESIINLSNQRLKYNIGYHPNFGHSFIDYDLELNMPDCEVEILWPGENPRFNLNEKGKWPYLKDKNGNKSDLRIIPKKNSGISEIISFKGLESGFVQIKNGDRKVGLRVSFDKKILRNVSLWIVRNGDYGYPWYGNTNVVCVLPKSNHYLTMEDIEKKKDFLEIDPKGIVKTWINYGVTL